MSCAKLGAIRDRTAGLSSSRVLPQGFDFRVPVTIMTSQDHKSPRPDLFANFPRGVAILELVDPDDVSTWQLVEMNDFLGALVPPSIESFLSCTPLGLVPTTDLPTLYRQVLASRRPCMAGMLEGPEEETNADLTIDPRGNGNRRPYVLHAFPAGPRCVGIFLEAAYSVAAGCSSRSSWNGNSR